MPRTRDAHPCSVAGRPREPAREEAERQVVFAVDDERRAGIGRQARDEPFASERGQGRSPALPPEAAAHDPLGDGRWIARPEEPCVEAIEPGFVDGAHQAPECEVGEGT